MPPEIRAALLLWLTALVVLEAGLGLAAGRDALRLALVAGVTVLVMRMAAGQTWARHTLAAVFALGTPWLAWGTLAWLAGDPAAAHLIGTAPGGLTSVLVAASVLAHAAASSAAVVYMYRPAANRYFRTAAPAYMAAEAH